MRAPVVIDLETKKTFREVRDNRDLGVSTLGLYSYEKGQLFMYEEHELGQAFPLMENASIIIGFNINSFDLPVLQPYYPGKFSQFKTFDIIEDVKERIGRRLSLNDLVWGTLGKQKSGHGLQAIEFYRQGNMEALKKYCGDDVTLTKELFDYGVQHHEIKYFNERGKVSIQVDWGKYLRDQGEELSPLTLPFE